MNSPNNLEIKGNLREYPLAELLLEISQAKLNGSLRVSDLSQKVVVYFDAGDIVFVVSNARAFRLFEMLLRENKATKQELLAIADFTNDLALSQTLLKNNSFSKAEMDALFNRQIEEILRSVLGWRDGEWVFSPLVRIKGDIRFSVDLSPLLIEIARSLPEETVVRRLENAAETFSVKPVMPIDINLFPEEAFVFSRFENSALTVSEAFSLSGLPEKKTRHTIYILWFGGFLRRDAWNAAFSAGKTAEILSANLSLKKDEKPPAVLAAEPKLQSVKTESAATEKDEAEQSTEKTVLSPEEISLADYLVQIEEAATFYDGLKVAQDADLAQIKQAYFALARRFHPDLFHKTPDEELRQRVQNAFTQIAQAYETLKTKSSRDVYDFRMRKELADAKKRPGAGGDPKIDSAEKQSELASENFEQGFNLLMKEEYETAIPFLARAVYFKPDNARYHAYYGKSLAADYDQRHKAEAELQTAVRLDATNADWRLMLAEFFVEVGLVKRAEGELKRLLAIFPGNAEAKTLLDSLAQK